MSTFRDIEKKNLRLKSSKDQEDDVPTKKRSTGFRAKISAALSRSSQNESKMSDSKVSGAESNSISTSKAAQKLRSKVFGENDSADVKKESKVAPAKEFKTLNLSSKTNSRRDPSKGESHTSHEAKPTRTKLNNTDSASEAAVSKLSMRHTTKLSEFMQVKEEKQDEVIRPSRNRQTLLDMYGKPKARKTEQAKQEETEHTKLIHNKENKNQPFTKQQLSNFMGQKMAEWSCSETDVPSLPAAAVPNTFRRDDADGRLPAKASYSSFPMAPVHNSDVEMDQETKINYKRVQVAVDSDDELDSFAINSSQIPMADPIVVDTFSAALDQPFITQRSSTQCNSTTNSVQATTVRTTTSVRVETEDSTTTVNSQVSSVTAVSIPTWNQPGDREMTPELSKAGKLISRYIRLIASCTPASMQERILEDWEPILVQWANVLEFFITLFRILLELCVEIGVEVWTFLQPYKPQHLFPALVGLAICFFGGAFMTCIAAAEAYRMVGYDSTLKCIKNLAKDFKKVIEANKKDDETIFNSQTDLDTLFPSDSQIEGNPENQSRKNSQEQIQIVSGKELVARKTLLFLKTVDPHRFTDAIVGINAGFIAVVATLKLQFAKTITLGHSISKSLDPPVQTYILPIVEASMPSEYKRWAKPILTYSIRSLAISIAWGMRRVISSYHSAIRGGLMFSKNLMGYFKAMGWIEIDLTDSFLERMIGYSLALVGLWFQLSFGRYIPFPLNILLLPFTILEYGLVWLVNNSPFVAT